MKIEEIFLENFRAFYGLRKIKVDNFTVLIGKNDQGKSSVLEAIDIFINEIKVEQEDLNTKAKNEGKDSFRIGITFSEFPDEVIIDANNPTKLSDEYLLNKDGMLEVWKTFKNGRLKETAIKCNHPVNDEVIKNLLRTKRDELKNFVESKNLVCNDKRKSALLRKAIRDSYNTLQLEEIEIVVDAEDAKKIWEQLYNYLPVYSLFHSDRKNQDLDSEIQDPLKIVIEQIFKRDEVQKKLNEIAENIEKEINTISENTIQHFKNITNQESKIKPNIPDVATLKWKDVYKNIGFNTENDVPLNKRGSGFRRLMLLSFFLAETEKQKSNEKVHTIYAIEEPETSLHPDLQKILLESLMKLSEDTNYQVLLTTHSSQFIRIIPNSSIRYIDNGTVNEFNENVLNKIIENLGVLPNVSKVIWCVEGKNDETFLKNINQNIPELKKIINLEESMNSGMLALNLLYGSNCGDYIDRYIIKNTNAIEFHLYDKDDDNKYNGEIERVNKRNDGSIAKRTTKREIENYIPQHLIENEFNIKLNNISNWDKFDIPVKVSQLTNQNEKKVKEILNSKTSRQIKKEDLENLNAWAEVVEWFTTIKELIQKVQ